MVRYLSRRYLEQLAKQHTDRYYQHLGASDMPIPVNPTVLAVETLGLNVQYLPLCQNGNILGLSAFDDAEITLHLEDGSEDHKLLTNRDIVIDTALMADDKIGRCNFTIAHETAQHIQGVDRALAISIGLPVPTEKKMILCLCSACARNFRDTGAYSVRRITEHTERDTCTYCNRSGGLDYEVVPKESQAREVRT